jgi:hypothetical protein
VDAEKEEGMIGMDFHEFVVLLTLSFIASIAAHYLLQHRHLECFGGILSKWLAICFGAWIGQPRWAISVSSSKAWVVPAFHLHQQVHSLSRQSESAGKSETRQDSMTI